MKRLSNSIIILFYSALAIATPLFFAYQTQNQNILIIEEISVVLALVFSFFYIPKLRTALKKLDTYYDYNPLIIKAAICAAGVLLLAHWVACGWLALRGISELDGFHAYVKSYYWAVSSLTTVGYGDIVPQSTSQYAYAILVMLLGVGMYAFIVGSIASIISQRDHAHAAYRERLEKLRSYLQYHQVTPELRHKIWKYYKYLWEHRLGIDEFNTLSEIPEPLRTEVAVYLVGDLLKSSAIFKEASAELIDFLAPRLKPRLSMPEDIIISEGAPAVEMYFISKGEAEVLKNKSSVTLAKLIAGDHFGEMALLNDLSLRNASVRALTVVEYYALDRTSFVEALKLFPDFALQIELIANERTDQGVLRPKQIINN